MNIEYKKVTDLTDDEVKSVMEIVYGNMEKSDDNPCPARIESIERRESEEEIVIKGASAVETDEDEDSGERFCYIEDYFELTEDGLEAYDFGLSGEEADLVRKKLFSLGCCSLLKDNPYL